MHTEHDPFDPTVFLGSAETRKETHSFEDDLDEKTMSLDPAQMLQLMLPNLALESINTALITNNYSISDTLDALLTVDNPQIELKSAAQKPSKQVCRHFLIGQCYRSDCWYSHDPADLICRFYLKGTCNKGDDCEFSHGDKIQEAIHSYQTIAPEINQAHLPSLGASLDNLTQFPALGSARNSANTKTIDFWAPTSKYADVSQKVIVMADTPANKAARNYEQKQSVERLRDIKWMDTGSSLHNNYLEFRHDAIEAANERNRICQQYFNWLNLELQRRI